MDLSEFERRVREDREPADMTPALRALWLDGRGDWDGAHDIAQDIDDATGSWIHAYLHRKEGDLSNAAYWYRRAARDVCRADLADEWAELVRAQLGG